MLAPLCGDWTLPRTDSMVLIRNHWPAFLCALRLPLVCFTAGKASAQPLTLSATIESHHPCAYYSVSPFFCINKCQFQLFCCCLFFLYELDQAAVNLLTLNPPFLSASGWMVQDWLIWAHPASHVDGGMEPRGADHSLCSRRGRIDISEIVCGECCNLIYGRRADLAYMACLYQPQLCVSSISCFPIPLTLLTDVNSVEVIISGALEQDPLHDLCLSLWCTWKCLTFENIPQLTTFRPNLTCK